MWSKRTTCNAGQPFAWIALACLAVVVLSAMPAAGQQERADASTPPPGSEARAQQQRLALAERQVAIKQAAVKIAEAQKSVAEAKVDTARAGTLEARTHVSRWESEAKRVAKLASANVVDASTVEETNAQLASAKASLATAEGKLLVAEREVAVEEARRQLAQAELAEAELRRDLLRESLPKAPDKAGAPQALLKTRLDAAQQGYDAAANALGEVKRVGNVNLLVVKPEEICTWSVRLLNAQRDMSDKQDKRIAALEEHVKRMKALENKVTELHPGLVSSIELASARWYLAEAELWLAKEKAR
jgi:hypothetical protein